MGVLCCGTVCVARAASPPGEVERAAPPRRYLPVALVRYAYFGRLAVPGTGVPGDVSLESQLLKVKVQAGHFFRSTGTVVAGSVDYQLFTLGSGATASRSRPLPLHHLSLRLALAQRVHSKWMISAFGKPGVASDYHGYHKRDLQLSAGAAARFAYRPNLTFLFGLLYNNGVFGHLVLPMLHIRYRWRFGQLLFQFPHKIGLWYLVHRKMELGLEGRFAAGVFGIHGLADRLALGDRLSGLYVTIGLVSRAYLWRGWYVSVEGGYLARYLRLFRDDVETHARLDFKGWYLSTAMGYLL